MKLGQGTSLSYTPILGLSVTIPNYSSAWSRDVRQRPCVSQSSPGDGRYRAAPTGVETFAPAARLDGQEDCPMTTSIIVGGWLAFNVVIVVALLFRRDRPAVDCRFEDASDEATSAHRPSPIRDHRIKKRTRFQVVGGTRASGG
jgi:hypothetical protein